jgi:putative transposase
VARSSRRADTPAHRENRIRDGLAVANLATAIRANTISSMQMPDGRFRKLRQSREDPGCAHEFTFFCYRRLKLLNRDRSRKWFVDPLDTARRKHQLELWAYVIMPEHVHVLFAPLDAAYRIRIILQSIKQPPMRRAINWLRENNPAWLDRLRAPTNGDLHFWQPGGGYDRNVNSASTAWNIVNYIHENPVKRGLVNRSVDLPWSSARWYAGEGDVMLPMDATPPAPGG